jgi:hypothetical protein
MAVMMEVIMSLMKVISAGMFALVFNWVVSILVLCNIHSILLLKRIITRPEALI